MMPCEGLHSVVGGHTGMTYRFLVDLGFAFEQPDPADRRRVIEETKRLLAAYLFSA